MKYIIQNKDCLEGMKGIPDSSIDSIVTDPPYGISFMGKEFDTFKGSDEKSEGQSFQDAMFPVFKEALRVAKPGAHLLAFGGTRTYHRLTCAIEDAGWEVRDCIMWAYGSGFPKSMDISKAIDKKLGAQREKRTITCGKTSFGLINDDGFKPHRDVDSNIPVTDEAKKWNGWGTCLKPAYEPVILARKPIEGTVVDNVLKYGVGGLNIDESRVPTDDYISTIGKTGASNAYGTFAGMTPRQSEGQKLGRFPANIIHDGSDEVIECFPDTGVSSGGGRHTKGIGAHKQGNCYGKFNSNSEGEDSIGYGDSGSAARFFYCAKTSKKERGEGNNHPTVKPIALMKYLIQLVTPKGGIVLDPFMRSGSTGLAALELGDGFIGFEKEPDYFKIAEGRLNKALPQTPEVV